MSNIFKVSIFSCDEINVSDKKGFGKMLISTFSFSLIDISSQASPIPSLSESNWSGL